MFKVVLLLITLLLTSCQGDFFSVDVADSSENIDSSEVEENVLVFETSDIFFKESDFALSIFLSGNFGVGQYYLDTEMGRSGPFNGIVFQQEDGSFRLVCNTKSSRVDPSDIHDNKLYFFVEDRHDDSGGTLLASLALDESEQVTTYSPLLSNYPIGTTYDTAQKMLGMHTIIGIDDDFIYLSAEIPGDFSEPLPKTIYIAVDKDGTDAKEVARHEVNFAHHDYEQLLEFGWLDTPAEDILVQQVFLELEGNGAIGLDYDNTARISALLKNGDGYEAKHYQLPSGTKIPDNTAVGVSDAPITINDDNTG